MSYLILVADLKISTLNSIFLVVTPIKEQNTVVFYSAITLLPYPLCSSKKVRAPAEQTNRGWRSEAFAFKHGKPLYNSPI